MIYQIVAKEKQIENECDTCALVVPTYLEDFNEKKGYNFINKERFSTDITDTKFRYVSDDDVVQLKIAISEFNQTVGEDVISLIELI